MWLLGLFGRCPCLLICRALAICCLPRAAPGLSVSHQDGSGGTACHPCSLSQSGVRCLISPPPDRWEGVGSHLSEHLFLAFLALTSMLRQALKLQQRHTVTRQVRWLQLHFHFAARRTTDSCSNLSEYHLTSPTWENKAKTCQFSTIFLSNSHYS